MNIQKYVLRNSLLACQLFGEFLRTLNVARQWMVWGVDYACWRYSDIRWVCVVWLPLKINYLTSPQCRNRRGRRLVRPGPLRWGQSISCSTVDQFCKAELRHLLTAGSCHNGNMQSVQCSVVHHKEFVTINRNISHYSWFTVLALLDK